MQQITLEAKKREETGKVPVKQFRAQALVPGIIYGKKMKPSPICVSSAALAKVLSHGAAHKIINLQIESNGAREDKMCVIQEIQRNIIGRQVIHVDFHNISMEEKLTAKIPITIEGAPAGAKEGGVLDHVLWEVEVKALPLNLPEKFILNVSPLLINQSLHVKDIAVPEGVEILEDPAEVVVVVHPPRVEEVAAPVATTTEGAPAPAAQPEVISKGKKEEEEPAEEAKPKK